MAMQEKGTKANGVYEAAAQELASAGRGNELQDAALSDVTGGYPRPPAAGSKERPREHQEPQKPSIFFGYDDESATRSGFGPRF